MTTSTPATSLSTPFQQQLCWAIGPQSAIHRRSSEQVQTSPSVPSLSAAWRMRCFVPGTGGKAVRWRQAEQYLREPARYQAKLAESQLEPRRPVVPANATVDDAGCCCGIDEMLWRFMTDDRSADQQRRPEQGAAGNMCSGARVATACWSHQGRAVSPFYPVGGGGKRWAAAHRVVRAVVRTCIEEDRLSHLGRTDAVNPVW